MRKFMLAALFVGALGFTACGSDDDSSGDDGGSSCETCDIQSITVRYCDNGDGTMTVTTAGIDQEVPLGDTSFDDYIDALETAGASCN